MVKRHRAIGAILFLLAMLLSVHAAAQARVSLHVAVLTIEGVIGPASADYFERGLEQASKDGAALVVLRMDTPGGLDTSMRQIIKAILASPVKVASFVAPQGARAASAGTYILYASHVAAMAPGTNLGAATPVAVGLPAGGQKDKSEKPSAMEAKQVNDSAAYPRNHHDDLRDRCSHSEWRISGPALPYRRARARRHHREARVRRCGVSGRPTRYCLAR